jgi:hypothetical protein
VKTKLIPDHPYAQLFPMQDRAEIESLAERIAKVGQIERGIVLDGKLLDGRNRQEACAIAGAEFKTMRWEDLPADVRAMGPLEYVVSKNYDRRQLTKSQKSICAAEFAKALEAEAAERSAANLKQNASAQDEFSQDNGVDAAEESQAPVKRGPGRPRKNPLPAVGKTSEVAGKRFGVSARSVDTAKSLLKKSPKKAAKVKAGETTLNKAARDAKKEADAKEKLEAAYKRIGAVCGRTLAQAARDGTRLKGRKEVMAFVDMDDEDMKRTQGLIESGWSVKRARLFRAVNLTPKHKIDDLINRAIAARGKFDTSISGFTISLRREKEGA